MSDKSNKHVFPGGLVATLLSTERYGGTELEHVDKYIAILEDMKIVYMKDHIVRDPVNGDRQMFRLYGMTDKQQKELGERLFDAIDCHCPKCEEYRKNRK